MSFFFFGVVTNYTMSIFIFKKNQKQSVRNEFTYFPLKGSVSPHHHKVFAYRGGCLIIGIRSLPYSMKFLEMTIVD